MTKKFILILVSSIALSLFYSRDYLLDRTNFRQNKIHVKVRGFSTKELKNMRLRFVGERDVVFDLNNSSFTIQTLDWYGKDHFSYSYHLNRSEFYQPVYIGFNEPKLRSWEKVRGNIEIKKEDDKVIIDWELETSWRSNKSSDTLRLELHTE